MAKALVGWRASLRHCVGIAARGDKRSRPTPAVHSEQEPSMCAYSLHHVASRPATVGDKLVTAKFVNTPTGGFAALDNANVAVCLRPGTELAFEHDVEC